MEGVVVSVGVLWYVGYVVVFCCCVVGFVCW